MAARAIIKQWANKTFVLSDQDSAGGYFVATNLTPGTAFAAGVSATWSATAAFFIYKNPNPANSLRQYLDYLKIIPTVAPASGTAAYFAIVIDTVNRYTSGGTLIGGPGSTQATYNVNGDSGVSSTCGLYAASGGTVITAPAAGTSARTVSRGVLRSVIPAIGDELVLSFGSGMADAGSSSGTAAGRTATNAPPIIVGPGEQAVVHIWFPSNATTGLSYEFETAWGEF